MALIDIALGLDNKVVVDVSGTVSEADLVDLGVLNADTVIYYGEGDVDLTSLLGVNALNNANLVASGGCNIKIDAGLLDLDLLNKKSIFVDGDSSVTLDAGAVGVASAVTNLLSNTTIAFSGSGDGTFTFEKPDLGILSGITINVEAMGPGDKVVIPFAGDGIGGSSALREGNPAWNNGYLNLTNGGLLNSVNVRIKMSEAEYAAYTQDKDAYLNGATDTFTFPGNDDDEPPYAVPCFAGGTRLLTPSGETLIEDLREGDLVITRDNGLQKIRWMGTRKLGMLDLLNHPNLRPIRIQQGALGANIPASDLLVSPQHRILVRSAIAARMFGTSEVLVAAKQLLQLQGVDIDNDVSEVEYTHVLFDQHEVVFANGTETESLFTGTEALRAVGPAAHEEISLIFPHLADADFQPQSARTIVSARQARKLAVRHIHKNRPLVM